MPLICPVISHPYPSTTAEHIARLGQSLATRERPQDTQFEQLL